MFFFLFFSTNELDITLSRCILLYLLLFCLTCCSAEIFVMSLFSSYSTKMRSCVCCCVPIHNIVPFKMISLHETFFFFPQLMFFFLIFLPHNEQQQALLLCRSKTFSFRFLPLDIPLCRHSILPSFPLIQYVSFFSSSSLEYLQHPVWLPDI